MNSTISIARRGAAEDRGSVTVEYVVVLCLVSIGCMLAMVALGAPLVRQYAAQAIWISLSVP